MGGRIKVGGTTRHRGARLFRLTSIGALMLAAALSAGAMVARALESGFADEAVLTGLTAPTNVEFAADGRVFVAEKGGRIKVFDSLSDPSPDLFADLSSNVHDFWDRGLLGLAIHPDFPGTPYVYVLYTYDAAIGGSTPTWGDTCPDPPDATDDGCLVSGRLSRLTASGNQMTGPELVLIEDWCQQYPSHSIGDLEFGSDGALYAAAGDGASFTWVDYGQGGAENGPPFLENPCGDPPVPAGGNQTTPTAEGGALRSQDLRTSGDPVGLDGTIIRIDPLTGTALPTNPLFSASDPNERRIVADGLRNPFRMAIKPGTNEVFVGDVGWSDWEEVNHHPDPTQTVRNFGWPCYEGGSGVSTRQSGYESATLNICEDLYSSGSVDASLFAYDHDADISGSDQCPPANPPQGTSSSISGLAFYEGGDYPGSFDGALFGADYSRDCIWVMYPDGSGDPDPTTVSIFQHEAMNPVDLEAGPNGDIFYVNIEGGEVRRFRFTGSNTPPTAVLGSSTSGGPTPLTVDFDGHASSDPDEDEIVLYEWDLDGDGSYDDDVGVTTQHTFVQPGSHTVRLRVTDERGETGTDSTIISASNVPPVPSIDTPSASSTWIVGDSIAFSGTAEDPDEGTLPGSALDWTVILHHCEDDGSCHEHSIQTISGVASGSFTAPDHEYPSWLELELTATDQYDVSVSTSVILNPETVDLTFAAQPTGLDLVFVSETKTAPFVETVIVNSKFNIGTPSPQGPWFFDSWSDSGAISHVVTAPAAATTYTAYFNSPPVITSASSASVPEGTIAILDVDSIDNADSEGAGLTYAVVGGPDQASMTIDASSGGLFFEDAPDFERPTDQDKDNVYLSTIRVTDSGGLSDSISIAVTVTDLDDPAFADAGSNSTTELGAFAVLDGSGSHGLTHQWTVVDLPTGASFTLAHASSEIALFRGDTVGVYVLELSVADDSSVDTDETTVTIVDQNQHDGTFVDDDASVFQRAIEWMAATGISKGCNPPANDRYCPNDNVTRGQIAAFFIRAFGWTAGAGSDLYTDDNGHIFENAIDIFGTEGVTQGCNPPANDRYCPNDNVTRGQMAAFFMRAFGGGWPSP